MRSDVDKPDVAVIEDQNAAMHTCIRLQKRLTKIVMKS